MANQANQREQESGHQKVDDKMRQTAEKAAEQTRQFGQTVAETGSEVARAGADIVQQNAETLQNTWRMGLDTTAAMMGRSADQLSRTFGLSGNEAQEAVQRSARNTESILYSGAAISRCMAGASREYFEFVRRQLDNSMDRMDELLRCRTPHDLAAVQTDIVRQSVEGALESSRRVADMSLKLADDATKHMTQTMDRMRTAA